MKLTRFSMAVLLLAALAIPAAAQQSSSDQAPAQQPAAQSQQPAPEQGKDAKKDKKKKKDKKEKKDDSGQDVQDTGVFSQREANDVLGQIRDGLEGHSQRYMLGAFDADKMDGYLSFEDQIEAFFNRYEAFRVNIHIVQSSVENGKGIVSADFQMEETPRSGQPTRKSGTLRFELEHTKKGWRVVDVSPRGFFN